MNTKYHLFGLLGFEIPLRASLAALVLALGTACSGTDQTAYTPAEEPLARFAASEETGTHLHVASWEIFPDGENTKVIGQDAQQGRQVELIVRQDAEQPGDRVGVESLFPETGTLQLTRTGAVEGTSSDYLARLGTALQADLGKLAKPLPGGSDDPPETGSASFALSTVTSNSGRIDIGWNLFGHGGNLPVQGSCGGNSLRDHFTTMTQNGVALCSIHDWMSDDPRDCSVVVSYSIGGGSWDTCYYYVYRQ